MPPSRFDNLKSRLKCSLKDICGDDVNINDLEKQIKEVAERCRKQKKSVIELFHLVITEIKEECKGEGGVNIAEEYFEINVHFMPGDKRSAAQVNAERLWMAWIEYLHGEIDSNDDGTSA